MKINFKSVFGALVVLVVLTGQNALADMTNQKYSCAADSTEILNNDLTCQTNYNCFSFAQWSDGSTREDAVANALAKCNAWVADAKQQSEATFTDCVLVTCITPYRE